MPIRKVIFENGNYYHILNRSIQNIPIFGDFRQCKVFIDSLKFYNQLDPPRRFSLHRDIPKIIINPNNQLVDIVNYCLMPNHFHLTLFQKQNRGITTFIQHVTNSFSHFYNIKFKNIGPLFQGNFKAIEVENIEQLLHLSRYIHLNPVTARLVEKPENYKYSSYKAYIGLEKENFINPKPVLDEFKSIESYKKFVMLQKDYQRKLNKIKKLTLENHGSFYG